MLAIGVFLSVVVITQLFFCWSDWGCEQAKYSPWNWTISTGGLVCSPYVGRGVIMIVFRFLPMWEKR